MKTDGKTVFFKPADISVIRHHHGVDHSSSRKMIQKLVERGVATKNAKGEYTITLDNFLFYFVLSYRPSMKEMYIKKYFPQYAQN